MLKYLVILLDDTSTSYCHYENEKSERRLIGLEDLKAGVIFAMKENLMIQFVYPDYELPEEYKEVIHSIDHSKIVPSESKELGDVIILNGWKKVTNEELEPNSTYVLRSKKDDFFKNYHYLNNALDKVARLNIAITDIDSFSDSELENYKSILDTFVEELEQMYIAGKNPQLNLLTDRILLSAMNNCNAGWECVTLAPDGKFYVCPAFYQADCSTTIEQDTKSLGDLKTGLDIKNPQLYKLSHAPLCRNCDAYQCKRCIWLNRKTTLEVNTPSHEQCVMAHLERNASRSLLENISKYGEFMPNVEIKEINYLDPFDVRNEW
jgi:CXXX repeat peptide maturase